MLNEPDAERVAREIGDCFAAIAGCEQDLHTISRLSTKCKATGASGTLDAFIEALEAEILIIDEATERLQLPDDDLLNAPLMPADELVKALGQISVPATPYSQDPGEMAHWLAPLITRAQLIDAWLEPAFNIDMDLSSAQGAFRDAFDLDGHVALPDGAILLPRRRPFWLAEDEGADSLGLFARYLRGVAYLPAQLQCDHPDIQQSSGSPIAARYQFWASPSLQANPVPEDPVIAVAPLAEQGSDVAFVPSICRSKYGLQLAYDETRFAAALSQALDQGVHILLIPEMALPEGDPSDFELRMRSLFLEVQADHYHRTGKTGELRFVIAGVLGGERPDGFHRNYAVAFDTSGDQPEGFQQLKLSHWNLSRKEQDLFGVTHYQSSHGALSDPIVENSLPASCLGVLEIPGLGRTATFICSDMSQDNPSDWLSLNALLDWMYAPIMDKSICWQTSDQMGFPRPWIVQRSYRSARLTRTLVIATNSMALSRWVNDANPRIKSKWPLYAEAGIGLAIDGRCEPPSHSHLPVEINSRRVLESFASPISDWEPFPLLA